MRITPRRLVRQALTCASPERVPRHLWLLPWAAERYPARSAAIQAEYPDDIVTADPFLRVPLPVSGERYRAGTYIDEWGCLFENVQGGVIGQVKRPLLEDWSRADRIRPPAERLTVGTGEVNAFCRSTDRFVLSGCWPRPFERLQFIRGTENLFFDLMERPAGFDLLLGRIHEFYLREYEVWAGTEVDALTLMDDWGTQDSMLIAPDLWRALFKPLYRDYVEIAHRAGKYFFMHSDGYILDILPDLIEIGVDAINCQVFCMGPELLGDRFRGQITFWGEPDRQRLLPEGTRADVFEAVRRMRESLCAGGGVIAMCEFGLAANPDNVEAYFDAWLDS
jgi:uroporphyrinogen decarboxylase